MAAFREEPSPRSQDAELIGGPADGTRVWVSELANTVEVPVATSQDYKLRTAKYHRASDPRKFEYVPNKST